MPKATKFSEIERGEILTLKIEKVRNRKIAEKIR